MTEVGNHSFTNFFSIIYFEFLHGLKTAIVDKWEALAIAVDDIADYA